VTAIDWIIVAFVVFLGVYGYAQGFLVGALSVAGFAAGAFLGTRLGPELLPQGSESPYAPLFGLGGALLGGAILASGLEGIGIHLRRRVRDPALGVLDGVLGAALSACLALGLAWLLGAVALQTPGAREFRDEIQRSEVLRRLNAALPPSGPILNALARFDPFPRITGPEVNVPPPATGIARDPDVAAAGDGVVKIHGNACGLGIAGSGWVAGPDVVVTNAHVVAGQDETEIQVRGRGPELDAVAVHFDSRNDLAILRVRGLEARELRLTRAAAPGTDGAVLGFPQDGPYDVRPARLGETRTAISQDAYGNGPVTRTITAFRALVREGNSGGPMVDAAGRVVTTVFAATVGGPQGGYGVPNSVVREALSRAGRGQVDTGPCTR
jgi:hypothetical protein